MEPEAAPPAHENAIYCCEKSNSTIPVGVTHGVAAPEGSKALELTLQFHTAGSGVHALAATSAHKSYRKSKVLAASQTGGNRFDLKSGR
ncbi:hypothetical protein QN413_26635 [Variovorax sp. LG9.2]|jgi:hypothetical protein|nr:hypothetical protein [Variovorax sp. LG9.2]